MSFVTGSPLCVSLMSFLTVPLAPYPPPTPRRPAPAQDTPPPASSGLQARFAAAAPDATREQQPLPPQGALDIPPEDPPVLDHPPSGLEEELPPSPERDPRRLSGGRYMQGMLMDDEHD